MSLCPLSFPFFCSCHRFLLFPPDARIQTDGVFPQEVRDSNRPARQADERDLGVHKVHQDVLLGGFLRSKYSQ